MPQCDFCTVPNTTRVYPARTFTISVKPKPTTTLIATSLDDWHACTECATLIDANDGSALADRATTLILAKHNYNIPREALREAVATWHAAFYANRITENANPS